MDSGRRGWPSLPPLVTPMHLFVTRFLFFWPILVKFLAGGIGKPPSYLRKNFGGGRGRVTNPTFNHFTRFSGSTSLFPRHRSGFPMRFSVIYRGRGDLSVVSPTFITSNRRIRGHILPFRQSAKPSKFVKFLSVWRYPFYGCQVPVHSLNQKFFEDTKGVDLYPSSSKYYSNRPKKVETGDKKIDSCLFTYAAIWGFMVKFYIRRINDFVAVRTPEVARKL